MTLDTMTFFEIVLSGFMTVWTFHHFSKSDKKYAEFEWLGLSTFWGLVIITTVTWLLKSYPNLNDLLANPFATGLVTSFFGIILGFVGGKISRFF